VPARRGRGSLRLSHCAPGIRYTQALALMTALEGDR